MTAILLAVGTFFSTGLGGLFGVHHRRQLHLVMGFTAGVLVGLVALDLVPEIFHQVAVQHVESTGPMLTLVAGFLAFHIVEKTVLIHQVHEQRYAPHTHPAVGILSAVALSGHSFLDGLGIGLGFKVSTTAGIAVAVAVIAHDFVDGLNTVTLMLINGNTPRRALTLLLVDATAPILGALTAAVIAVPAFLLPLYLGFFAGFLLYIGASDILPQAHSKGSNATTILLTVLGAAFAFAVSRFA
jgi:zinc transporter ZupT